MKRPSDDSSRRMIPVQFWEVLHTFKYFFFLKLNILKLFFYCFFFEFLKTLLLDLTMQKRPKNPRENNQAYVIKKIIDSHV